MMISFGSSQTIKEIERNSKILGWSIADLRSVAQLHRGVSPSD